MALVSLCFILAILMACDLARQLILWLKLSRMATTLAMDAVLSVETCAVGFEMGVINELHGVYFWLSGIFCNCLYQSFRWRGLTPPIPYMQVMDYMDGKQTAVNVMLRSAVMVAAGVVTHRYLMASLWKLELVQPHVGRWMATSTQLCRVPWAWSVSVSQSFFTEVLGTMALVIGPNLVIDNQTITNNEPRLANILIAAMVVVTVWLGMDLSGGFYSPMLATVVFGGCKGHTWVQHGAIYWVGATMGALLGHKAYPSIKSVIYSSPAAAAVGVKAAGKKNFSPAGKVTNKKRKTN